jgi:hypothetical protein
MSCVLFSTIKNVSQDIAALPSAFEGGPQLLNEDAVISEYSPNDNDNSP